MQKQRKIKLLSTIIMLMLSLLSMSVGVFSATNLTYSITNNISYETNIALKITASVKAYNKITTTSSAYSTTGGLPTVGSLSTLYNVGGTYYIYCNSSLDYGTNEIIKTVATGAGYKQITTIANTSGVGNVGSFYYCTADNLTYTYKNTAFVQTAYRKISFIYSFNSEENVEVFNNFEWNGSITSGEDYDQVIGNSLYFDNTNSYSNSNQIVFEFMFKNIASINTARVYYPQRTNGQISRSCSLSPNSTIYDIAAQGTTPARQCFELTNGSSVSATFAYTLNYVTQSISILNNDLSFTIDDDDAALVP